MDPQEETDKADETLATGDQDVDTVVDECTEKNGDVSNNHEDAQPAERSPTSSPSGRSGSCPSNGSNGSRRRVETDTVKEVVRSVSPKPRRRHRDSRSPGRKSRTRTPSVSPKRIKRERTPSPRRSRSRSGSRRRSDRDSHRRNGGSERRRRTRSPPPRRRSRTRSPRGPRYGRNPERDHPKPSRCIGVFGLSTRTREKDLREEFEKYGPLDNVQLIHDHKTGRSRGFGFVYFGYLGDAERARNAANGMIMDDRRIRVDFSLTQRNRSPPRSPPRYEGERSSRSRSPVRRRRSRSRSYRRSRSVRRSRS